MLVPSAAVAYRIWGSRSTCLVPLSSATVEGIFPGETSPFWLLHIPRTSHAKLEYTRLLCESFALTPPPAYHGARADNSARGPTRMIADDSHPQPGHGRPRAQEDLAHTASTPLTCRW